MSTNDEQFTGYRTNHPDDIAHFASVRSFQDFLVDKTNPVVMVTLTVNDKGFLDNATFETHLTQHTNTHDEFTIVVNDTAIDDFKGQVMKNSKDLLGENITIHFHQFGGVIQSFKGIIANICNRQNLSIVRKQNPSRNHCRSYSRIPTRITNPHRGAYHQRRKNPLYRTVQRIRLPIYPTPRSALW